MAESRYQIVREITEKETMNGPNVYRYWLLDKELGLLMFSSMHPDWIVGACARFELSWQRQKPEPVDPFDPNGPKEKRAYREEPDLTPTPEDLLRQQQEEDQP